MLKSDCLLLTVYPYSQNDCQNILIFFSNTYFISFFSCLFSFLAYSFVAFSQYFFELYVNLFNLEFVDTNIFSHLRLWPFKLRFCHKNSTSLRDLYLYQSSVVSASSFKYLLKKLADNEPYREF